MTTVQHVPSFTVNQKLAMTTNRYEVVGPDGTLLAVAQQKRLALKEKVTFYTDESRRQEAFTFGARNVMELRGAYDVVASDGSPLGTFRKQFGASLMRTTVGVAPPRCYPRSMLPSRLLLLGRRGEAS